MNSFPLSCREDAKQGSFGVAPLLVGIFWGILFCLPAHSQSLGRISGIVRDANGAAVSGTVVTVTEVGAGISRVVNADDSGAYFVTRLLPGTYSVRFVHRGSSTFVRENVVLEIAGDVQVDATLEPGEQGQTITARGEFPPVITANAELSSILSADILNQLPVLGHNYVQLLALFPTFQLRQGSSAGPVENSDGLRGEFNVYVLDGIADQESYYTTSPLNTAYPDGGPEQAVLLPTDSIQEFNIIQNANAQFGWRPGAQVNVGIQPGTNSIHGAGFASGRSTGMTGENFFASATPSVSFEDFDATVGGAMKKNRLLFDLGYEGQRYDTEDVANEDVPSVVAGLGPAVSLPDAIVAAGSRANGVMLALSGCTLGPPPTCTPTGLFSNNTNSPLFPINFPAFGKSNNGLGRVDFHLDNHNNFGLDYFEGAGSALFPFAATQSYWSTPLVARSQVLRGWWTWSPNSTWVNDLRAGWDNALFSNSGNYDCPTGPGTYNSINDNAWISGSNAPNYQTISGFEGGSEPSCAFPNVQITGFTESSDGMTNPNLLGGAQSTFDTSGIERAVDTASWMHGKHIVTFGGEALLARGSISLNAGLNKGTLIFNSLTDFVEGAPDFYEIQLGNVPRQFNYESGAGFVQDQWRIFPRLTLNAGVRYEYTGTLNEKSYLLGNVDLSSPSGMTQQGQGAPLYKLDPFAFAPRFGLAYDVTGKGTTVLRAGFNIIYQNPTAEAFFIPGMNAVPTALNLSNGTLLINEGGTINLQNIATRTPVPSNDVITSNVPFFGTTLPLTQSCTPSAPCSIGGTVTHLDLPEILNWNFGIQHAVTNSLTLDVEYVGVHGQHLFDMADINQPTPGSTTDEQGRRPFAQYPWLGEINLLGANPAWSNYNALQVIARERLSHGLSLLATYTYSHALDTESSESELPQNSMAPGAAQYGNSSFDMRHHVAIGLSYLVPGKKGYGQLFSGWQVATVASIFSGRPFGAIDTGDDISGTGELEDRWNLVGNPKDFSGFGTTQGIPCYDANIAGTTSGAWTSACTAASAAPAIWQQCVNAATGEPNGPAGVADNSGIAQLRRLGCYAMGGAVIVPPAQGTFGDMSRNELYSVGSWEWDASILKNLRVTEKLNAQFRADFFNVTNQTFFAAPASALQSPSNFGQAMATPDAASPFVGSGGPRKIQVGLRLIF